MDGYPSRVTLFDDGVYRWSYDMDMWHNRFMLYLLMKVLGIICAVMFVFILFLIGPSGVTPAFFGYSLLAAAGLFAVTLLIYAICALAMHGNYHLCFEMGEDAVSLVRSASWKRSVGALTAVAAAAGVAMGKPGEALRAGVTLNVANAAGTTSFSSVRRVRQHPEYDVIDLRELFGMNQVYVNAEDYPLVLDFILAHVPGKARA